ncbi:hypothetical protein WP3W18C02_P20030 (plasmid) [Klebsiella quasipneumoniae]|nr:hypothetical protein WP3W18C02_P20030 [Klebsiella quasipneumoniae]
MIMQIVLIVSKKLANQKTTIPISKQRNVAKSREGANKFLI